MKVTVLKKFDVSLKYSTKLFTLLSIITVSNNIILNLRDVIIIIIIIIYQIFNESLINFSLGFISDLMTDLSTSIWSLITNPWRTLFKRMCILFNTFWSWFKHETSLYLHHSTLRWMYFLYWVIDVFYSVTAPIDYYVYDNIR